MWADAQEADCANDAIRTHGRGVETAFAGLLDTCPATRPGVVWMSFPSNLPAPLTLEDLSEGFPHVPPECGIVHVQSAVLCLEGQGHHSGALLNVQGSFPTVFRLLWSMDVTEAMRRYWNDPDEASEQGAYALALLMLRSLTGLTVLERSRKGTGFDWWLASQDNLFQAAARLEVSGIMRGSAR